MKSAGAKALRRHRVSLFILHFTFVIAGTAPRAAMTNVKCKM